MDGLDGLDGLDWILLRTLVQLEHLAVLKSDIAAGLLYNMGHGMQAVPVVTSPDGEVLSYNYAFSSSHICFTGDVPHARL